MKIHIMDCAWTALVNAAIISTTGLVKISNITPIEADVNSATHGWKSFVTFFVSFLCYDLLLPLSENIIGVSNGVFTRCDRRGDRSRD